jgi:hypothetical protein
MWAGTSRVSGTGWDQHSFRSVSGKVAGHFSFFFYFCFFTFLFFSFFFLEESEDCRRNWTWLCDILNPYHVDTTPPEWICNPKRWVPQNICPWGNHIVQCSWWADWTPPQKNLNVIGREYNSHLPGGSGAKSRPNLPEQSQPPRGGMG